MIIKATGYNGQGFDYDKQGEDTGWNKNVINNFPLKKIKTKSLCF